MGRGEFSIFPKKRPLAPAILRPRRGDISHFIRVAARSRAVAAPFRWGGRDAADSCAGDFIAGTESRLSGSRTRRGGGIEIGGAEISRREISGSGSRRRRRSFVRR